MPAKRNWTEDPAGCLPPPPPPSSSTSSSTSSSSTSSTSSSSSSSLLFPRLRAVLGALESDTRSLQQQLQGRGNDKRGAAESLTQLLAELRNIKATLSPRVSALREEVREGSEFLSSLRRSAHLLRGDVRELSVNLARYGYQRPPQQGERGTETETEEDEDEMEDGADDDSTDPEVATPKVTTPANSHDPNLTPHLSDSKFNEVAMEIRLRGGLGSQLLPLTPELPQCLSVAPPPAAAILPRGEVAEGHDPAAMLVGGEARAGGHDPPELPATPELPEFLRAAGDLMCGGDKRKLGWVVSGGW
ncbi:uncharacterized protein LOC142923148 [Petromyzon marinus]|uniref:uncharacterized protein LOC142923148 n=1 Tax=Petromyzon marinus TaxID=7757 RepID=UPI003F700AE9